MDSTGPFLHHILSHQVQHFHQGIVHGQEGFAFGRFPQLTILAFYDVCCAEELTDLQRIIEIGRNDSKNAPEAIINPSNVET